MVDDDSRAKKQEMSGLAANSDFISNLPDNVIDGILGRLPIRDAVRTSVLSTNWRYKWTTITQLVIHDDKLIPHSPHNNNDKIINSIDRVLLLHSGFIHKFELLIKCLPISSSMIDAWILFLSRKNIKELVLKFYQRVADQYKLPSCFYFAQQICTLVLHRCVLKPPPTTFTGFSNLKSIYLYETTFVDKGGFECLISKCPLLERLQLIYCILGHGNLNICSPNLKFLNLLSTFQDICFENTPLLCDVTIGCLGYFNNETFEKLQRIETRNVVKVLSSLPSLKKFEVVNGNFLKFLSVSKIPEKLPFTCHHLNHLFLTLNFECVNHMCVTLCLLKSAPNLRKLHIDSFPLSNPSHNIENFWEERTHIDWKMSRLQVVKITTYGFEFKSGLEFIKLLLANSPMLEKLSIIPRRKISKTIEMMVHGQKDMLLLQLLRFKRASPQAVIEFPGFA